MKNIIKLLISAAVIQLALPASAIPASIGTLAQNSAFRQRYQLFDSIVVKYNNLTTNDWLESTSINPNILRDINQWLLTNKDNITEDKAKYYQDLKKELINTIREVERFKKDPLNCELERKAQAAYFKLEYLQQQRYAQELYNEDINDIWNKHTNTLPDEKPLDREFFGNYFVELRADVEHFIQSLDDAGKEENTKLIEWFNKFRKAKDNFIKTGYFLDIAALFEEELARERKAGVENCRLLVNIEHFEGLKKIFYPQS